MVWMSPQSAKMETRRGRAPMEVCLGKSTVVLRRRERQDRQGSEKRWGGLGLGEASCEVERDEKEVNGAGHAEGDEVDELQL